MTDVLSTGAAGFLGQHVARELLADTIAWMREEKMIG